MSGYKSIRENYSVQAATEIKDMPFPPPKLSHGGKKSISTNIYILIFGGEGIRKERKEIMSFKSN